MSIVDTELLLQFITQIPSIRSEVSETARVHPPKSVSDEIRRRAIEASRLFCDVDMPGKPNTNKVRVA